LVIFVFIVHIFTGLFFNTFLQKYHPHHIHNINIKMGDIEEVRDTINWH